MPSSSFGGKFIIIRNVLQLIDDGVFEQVGTVLDVGAGQGTYFDYLAHNMPGYSWIALEAFEPYVETYGLREKYDDVIVGDFREFSFIDTDEVDIVFLGDVLEHMSKEDALECVNKAKHRSTLTVISIPIGDWPQEAVNDNPFEEHRSTWSVRDAMDVFGRPNAFQTLEEDIGVFAYLNR